MAPCWRAKQLVQNPPPPKKTTTKKEKKIQSKAHDLENQDAS
jgi:hypothetical protein